jgi:transposase-like protein
MSEHMISCPRCGSRSIGSTPVAEGAHSLLSGPSQQWFCRNCGESCGNLRQAPFAFPKLDLAVGAAAIVLTLLTAAGGMLF